MEIESIFAFLGGLGVFLYGMNVMAEGLQKAADTKMRQLLEALIKNKFSGVIVGALVTGIIQSSSATTVMVVSFVNAGFMNLTQAMGVIMGANIGTTITSWIISMGEWSKFLTPTVMSPVAIAIGAFMMMFCKKEKYHQIGEILLGFGFIFLGIEQIGNSFEYLQESKAIRDIFITFGTNPIMGVLAGAVITGIIQSSSASVAILQTLAAEGLVPFSAAIYIIMGQNIGTCITALLSSIGASKNAKAAAYLHLLFNIIGSVIFCIVAVIYFKFFNKILAATIISQTQISVVHTIFNIATTVLLYNFSDFLIKIAEKLTSHIVETTEEVDTVYLDERILEMPAFALQNVMKELTRLGEYTLESLVLATDTILVNDKSKIAEVYKREQQINKHEQLIIGYLVKISQLHSTEEEHNLVASLFRTANDIERVGDHCENLVELAESMSKDNFHFSDEALEEIKVIFNVTLKCFKSALVSFENHDNSIANEVLTIEDEIDKLELKFRKNHLNRLANNLCSSATGAVFLDTLSNLERIGDHSSNIAQSVLINKL